MSGKLIHAIYLVLSLGLPLTGVASAASPDLVGWWKFDEGSGNTAADSSGNENHGTLSATNIEWTDEGWIDGALNFTGGDNYVAVPDSPTLNPTEEITIAAWLKPSWTANNRVLQKGPSDNQYRLLRDWGGKFVFHLAGVSNGRLECTPCPAVGEWTHVAATYDGAAMKVYYNSKLVGELAASGGISTCIDHLYIGNKHSGAPAGDGYKGIMDEVRLYSRALTEAEVAAIYAGAPIDERIARDPNKVLREAYEDIQQFGDWRTNPTVRTESADEISEMLLIIAKAKEAKDAPSQEVLKDYYELTTQFPDSPHTVEALCKIVMLDKQNGLEYAMNFLQKSGTVSRTIAFYAALIRDTLLRSDYANTEKYVKLFIDRHTSSKEGLKFMVQLMSSLEGVPRRERLYEIIEHSVAQNPDSAIRCAVFRQRALALSDSKNFNGLLEMAESVRQKFPETRLATCATAVLADHRYQQGNFVSALEAFKLGLLAKHRPEPAIIKDIDNTLTLYNAYTLRTQGIDSGKLYKALAEYFHRSGRYAVAVHCYRQSAKAKDFSLDVFERAASEIAKYCNTGPENEVWFWKGLLTAEEGDLMTAAFIYEHFLKVDDSSILAAKALHTLARAQMALGWYPEAKETVAKAKSISSCQPVIELEQELTRYDNR